ALVLERPLASAGHLLQPLAPIDLVVETRRQGDECADAGTVQRLVLALVERAATVVLAVADVVERSECEAGAPLADRRQRQRDAQRASPDDAVVAHELVLAVAAHGVAAADRELLDPEQRVVGELSLGAREQLRAEPRKPRGPLQLQETCDEAAVR